MSAKIEQLVAMRLNTYFKHQPDTAALVELKTELAADLNEAANDKAASGFEPEEAVAEAFSDFGDINALIKQINEENGSTEHVHGHQVIVDDNGIEIDDGKTLKINADGLSINNGTIKADANGLKVGNWILDAHGLQNQAETDFDDERRSQQRGQSQQQEQSQQPGETSQRETDADQEQSTTDDTATDESNPHVTANLDDVYRERHPLVNEQRVSLTGLAHIAINYRAATVKVLPTREAGDDVIIRDYMNYNNPAYYSQVTTFEDRLEIVQGKVPFLIPLRVHVQILIPASYAGQLTLNDRSGNVIMGNLQHLSELQLQVVSGSARLVAVGMTTFTSEVTSGSLTMADVQVAEQLVLNVKSGRTRLLDVAAGNYNVRVTSGSVSGQQVRGGGQWTAKSGSIKLALAAINGDTTLAAHSGSIKVSTPADASYRYELESQSGRVTAPHFAQVDHHADGYQAGRVGTTATYLISGRARSGSISLS